MQALAQITGLFAVDERTTLIQQQAVRQPFDSATQMIGYIVAALESTRTALAVNMVLPFVRLPTLLNNYPYNREYTLRSTR